jgi:hypothetical protein
MLLTTRKLMKPVELRLRFAPRGAPRISGVAVAPAPDRAGTEHPGVSIARELISDDPAEFAVTRRRASGE